MLNNLLLEALEELQTAVNKEDHPFRYCSVASCDNLKNLRQRTMVLRDFTEDENLFFYTDSRSLKIEHFKENPNASVLLYHPQKKLQLIIQGKMIIVSDNDQYRHHKSNIKGNATNNYNTELPPGKPVKSPESISRTSKLHFALLKLEIKSIEYLKITKNPNHLRARFTKKENGWEKTFLVP